MFFWSLEGQTRLDFLYLSKIEHLEAGPFGPGRGWPQKRGGEQDPCTAGFDKDRTLMLRGCSPAS